MILTTESGFGLLESCGECLLILWGEKFENADASANEFVDIVTESKLFYTVWC